MSCLLLGVGNILLSDEAIGVRVIEAFEQKYRYNPDQLEVMDGGTAGMELLDALAERDLVVIVDAVVTGDCPGTVVRLEDEQVPRFFSQKISPHQLGLSDLLSSLYMIDQSPKKLLLVGAVPSSVEPHIGLTELLSERVDGLVRHVADLLTEQGIALQPIQLADSLGRELQGEG